MCKIKTTIEEVVLKCDFCSEPADDGLYCKHCEKSLCTTHASIGRGGIRYCPSCNSEYTNAIEGFIKEMKSFKRKNKLSKKVLLEMIDISLKEI